MPRLIFINRFYWPEEPATSQLLTDLAQGLAAESNEVAVITSRPDNHLIPRWETHRNVFINRIGSTRVGKSSLIGRSLDFLSFTLGVAYQLLTYPERKDTVIFLTDPPLLAAILSPILRLRGIRYLHWIQDVYPEIACELTRHRWLKLLSPLRDASWRGARKCITLGEDMSHLVRSHGVTPDQITTIPNWSPDGLNSHANPQEIEQLKQRWGLSGKFIALYSGNLGRVHDLSPLIDVAGELQRDKSIALVFIGDGAQVMDLKSKSESLGLENVFFFPPQPRHKLNLTLALGDIHFVSMRAGCEGYVYPSKLYGITAVGRPVIFIGPQKSDLAQTISSESIGLSFSVTDIVQIAKAVRNLSTNPEQVQQLQEATAIFTERHNFKNSLKAWRAILTDNE